MQRKSARLMEKQLDKHKNTFTLDCTFQEMLTRKRQREKDEEEESPEKLEIFEPELIAEFESTFECKSESEKSKKKPSKTKSLHRAKKAKIDSVEQCLEKCLAPAIQYVGRLKLIIDKLHSNEAHALLEKHTREISVFYVQIMMILEKEGVAADELSKMFLEQNKALQGSEITKELHSFTTTKGQAVKLMVPPPANNPPAVSLPLENPILQPQQQRFQMALQQLGESSELQALNSELENLYREVIGMEAEEGCSQKYMEIGEKKGQIDKLKQQEEQMRIRAQHPNHQFSHLNQTGTISTSGFRFQFRQHQQQGSQQSIMQQHSNVSTSQRRTPGPGLFYPLPEQLLFQQLQDHYALEQLQQALSEQQQPSNDSPGPYESSKNGW